MAVCCNCTCCNHNRSASKYSSLVWITFGMVVVEDDEGNADDVSGTLDDKSDVVSFFRCFMCSSSIVNPIQIRRTLHEKIYVRKWWTRINIIYKFLAETVFPNFSLPKWKTHENSTSTNTKFNNIYVNSLCMNLAVNCQCCTWIIIISSLSLLHALSLSFQLLSFNFIEHTECGNTAHANQCV